MPSLTRTEAAERAALLAVDAYAVDLDLTAGAQAGARNPLDPRQIITGTLRSVGLLKN